MHQQLIDKNYGFRIRFTHLKLLTQAIQNTFEEMINMKDDSDSGTKEESSKGMTGEFFKFKSKEVIKSDEELLIGEDFHNPDYDVSIVHPMGRFNQTFMLFKGMHIDADTLKVC